MRNYISSCNLEMSIGISKYGTVLEMSIGISKYGTLQLTGAQKPSKVCAELGPLGGSCSWGDMQTTPNLFELTLRVSREFRHAMPEDENVEAMPRWLYCLTMPPAQVSHEGCCVSNVVPENFSMNTVVRHVGQAMHEANDLIPPSMHPRPFRQLPKMTAGVTLFLRRQSCRKKANWTSAI